jgi:hypothetical protein
MPSAPENRKFDSFVRHYTTAALVVLNLIVLAAATFALAWLALGWMEAGRARVPAGEDVNPWLQRHGFAVVSRAYPGMNERDLNAFLNETYLTPFAYDPFTQLRSAPRQGRYFNVHAAGFRSVGPDQAPWPPPAGTEAIFVFGGSTALGAGVADAETVPAAIQRQVRARFPGRSLAVYNFGTGAHFSSQERAHFEKLLALGHAPKLAIFVDGLNEFYFWHGIPGRTDALTKASRGIDESVRAQGSYYHLEKALERSPLGRLIAALEGGSRSPLSGPNRIPETAAADPERIMAVIERYFRNKAMIEAVAERFGVKTLFVWQPVPLYKYPGAAEIERLLGDMIGEHRRHFYGYPAMAEHVRRNPPGPDFVWCADIQDGIAELLYVDHVHYTPAMAERVAKCAVDHVRAANILGP